MKAKSSFKCFLIALLVGAVATLSALYAQLFLIVVVAAIGFMSISWGLSYAMIALVISCAGVAAVNLSMPLELGCMLGWVLIGSVTLILSMRNSLPYRLITALLGILTLVAIYLGVCVPPLLAGEAPYAGIVQLLNAWEEFYQQAGIIDSGFGALAGQMPEVMYGYFILFAQAIAFITVVICKKFCTLSGCVVRPMAKFADWQVPDSMKIGLPMLAAACLILYIAGFRGAYALTFTLICLLAPMFFVQGIGMTLFMLRRGLQRSRTFGAFPVILVCLIALMVPFLFCITGIIELYTGTRRKFRKYDEKIRLAFEQAEREGRNTVTVDLGDGKGSRVIAVRKSKEGAFYDNDIKSSVQDESEKLTEDDIFGAGEGKREDEDNQTDGTDEQKNDSDDKDK